MAAAGEEAYHLEARRKQRMNDRRRELRNRQEGRESKLNTLKDFSKARQYSLGLKGMYLC